MNIEEASEFFAMNPDNIRDYEKQGLLQVCKDEQGDVELHDDDAHRLCFIRTMVDAGSEIETIKRFLDLRDGNKNQNEQIQILKKQRFRLLDDIHVKQQLLDRIDFIIQQIKDE